MCFCPQYSIQSRVNDCVNNSYGITIYPGETVHISVIGVGDYINSAQTIVYTTVTNESSCFINGSKLLVDQIPNTCTTFQYIVTSKISGNCTLNSWINDGDTSITAVYMKVLDCPFGFIPNENGVCDCHPLLISLHNPAMVINCNLTSSTFRRQGHTWLHTVNSNGTLTEVIASSFCDQCVTLEFDLSLTDLDSQCLYKRSGTLCGQCHSSVFGSPQCKICSNV